MSKFITIQQEDGTEQFFTDADLPLVIGSGKDSHIYLPEADPLCAYIAQDKGHIYIQPAERNRKPLFHNDHYLTSSAWLKSHDTIRLGSSLLRYTLSGDRIIIAISVVTGESLLQEVLQPPSNPPPLQSLQNGESHIPVAAPAKRFSDRKRRGLLALTGLLSLLLGCAVFFVLAARPLELNISPEPDDISLAGFPPPLTLASHLLALPGTYTLTIEKQGYLSLKRTVSISRDTENRFSATLEKLPGILDISTSPAGEVTVYTDNHLLGTIPPGSLEIPAGPHRLTLVRERYQPFVTEIDIEGMGIQQDLEATLKPDWAAITITSDPPGASVAVDNKSAGFTPVTLDLLSGTHSLLVTGELFVDSETTIDVTAGKTAQHHITLTPLPGQLTIVSTPDKATVRINEQYQGVTPLTVDLPALEDHEVVVSLAGFQTSRRSVRLIPGEVKQAELPLVREKGIIYLLITPPDAHVTLDGKPLEQIQGKLNLTVEPHTIEVKASGYKSQSRTIMPKTGFSQQVGIDLAPLSEQLIPGSSQEPPPSPTLTAAGQRLLLIQPSPFIMGAPRREPGRRANENERSINLSKSFYLSQKPVTNRQFRLFNKKHGSGAFAGNSLNGPEFPVVNITWEDAVSYLNWLSEQDGLQPFYQKQGTSFTAVSPPTNGYRLPTEAEWSFSARQVGSLKAQRFPWSGGFPPRMTIGNFADESARAILPQIITGYQDGFPVTSPVGTFPPNKGGLYDMGGNIAEWCHDFYSPSPDRGAATPPVDPLGPQSGTHHVIRGSSWRDSAITELRLSYRSYHREARNNVGFRVARYK